MTDEEHGVKHFTTESDNILYLLKDFAQIYSIMKPYQNLIDSETYAFIQQENIKLDL